MSDPILENNMKWNWRTKSKFLKDEHHKSQFVSAAELGFKNKLYRCKLFNHNWSVALLVKQFICLLSMLFPGFQAFHLIYANSRSRELFKIKLSTLDIAYLAQQVELVNVMQRNMKRHKRTKQAYWINKVKNPRIIHCTRRIFHQSLEVPWKFSNCMLQINYNWIKQNTNRLHILQGDMATLVWT